MSNLLKITVITIAKNSSETISNTIESVVRQNYPNLEYIVLDGGSNDGTIDIIKKYSNFINFFRSENDAGPADVYNFGASIASGEIIGYLNADDFYEDGILFKVAESFSKDPEVEILSFRYRVVEQSKNGYIVLEESSLAEIDLDKNKDCPCLGINAKFFRRELFAKIGLPLKHIKVGQLFLSNDIEFLIRAVLNDVKNLSIDEIGYNYLKSDNSRSFNNSYKSNVIYIEDKLMIAKRFLGKEFDSLLNEIWRNKFKKWVKKYRAKLFKYDIRQGNFRNAMQDFVMGARENGWLRFSFYLAKLLIRG